MFIISTRKWLSCAFWVWVAVLGGAHPARAAADGWQLETDKDGIQVYSRQSAGSRFKEIRVQCEMPGTLEQLVALYSDVANYRQVISNTRTAYLLRQVSETELFYYLESQMPAAVANRDVVMRLQFAYDAPTRSLRIHTTAVEGTVPVKAGVVRVPYWNGEWHVRALTPTRMHVNYCFRVDPGGTLPPWLVNLLAPVAPYQSFVKLRSSLRLSRYQNRHFAFLDAVGTP